MEYGMLHLQSPENIYISHHLQVAGAYCVGALQATQLVTFDNR